jgi:single-strand DNA-binding protein
MNLVEIIGYVGNDPEERMTPSGKKVISFRMADNIKSGDKEETIWWRISIWGDQFDRMMPYVKKGSALIVHGEIRRKPETYQDREGHTQVSMELTATQMRFLPASQKDRPATASSSQSHSHSNEDRGSYAQSAPSSAPGGFRPGQASDDYSDDNLPF